MGREMRVFVCLGLVLAAGVAQAQSYTTSWYNGTYKMVPTDLKGIATFIQPLWNATQAHCEK